MSVKKSALGRGLGALIEDANEGNKHEHIDSINEIDLKLIEVNPFQPRKTIDEDALQELAVSIRELGIIQPITVRRLENEKFQLITGERRYRASQIAGLTRIPAYIRTANDQSMLELALVENIQREDLDAIEIAISFQRLIEECSLTQEDLSDRVGKKRATVANYLRLLKLPAEMQLAIRERRITMGHARAIITIDSVADQKQLFHQILNEGLSVRQVEDIVRSLSLPKETKQVISKKKGIHETLSDYSHYQNQLRNRFNVKIEVKSSNQGEGKIIIPFHSDDELDKIVTMLDSLKLEE